MVAGLARIGGGVLLVHLKGGGTCTAIQELLKV